MSTSSSPQTAAQRLLSLDFLRGAIMVTLMLGETGFFSKLNIAFDNGLTQFLHYEFEHSVWRGLRLWDILLPSFLFIAGTALAFSYNKQVQLGYSWQKAFRKVLRRSLLLLLWGTLVYAVRGKEINLDFSNVLTELAFGTMTAFLIIRWPARWQFAASIVIILLTEFLYKFTNVPEFDQPFTDQHNFGNYMDLIVTGKVHPGHGPVMNWLPCAASVVWGMMTGQLLLGAKTNTAKVRSMLLFAALAIIAGLVMDLTGITPMLKWISSTSFVMVNAGVTLILLAVSFEVIDVRSRQKGLKFFTIVGMNSIFIYLFFTFIGDRWMNEFVEILVSGLLNKLSVRLALGSALSSLVVFGIEWYMCYFLYKKKLFFKL
ncbi:MAG: heparan-alpha-glucosaminide N-acetyltransferase domain-containing protein [Flavitalea sp.]